jgi:hypothetical protein
MSAVKSYFAVAAAVMSASAAAAPTAMFIPKAINLDPVQLEAFGAVCAMRYAAVSQSPVLTPAESQAAVGPNGSLTDAAKTLDVSELVELTLVNLSTQSARGRLLISAVRRSAEGAELFRADITAASLDDAVPACERLALALTQRIAPRDALNRRNVTAAEAHLGRPNRVGSEKVIGVKTSFGIPVSGEGQLNPLASVAFDMRLEQERYFIEFGAGILLSANLNGSSSSYGGINVEIGASYYLTDGDTAPYLGGGVQPRLVFSGSILGIAPYAQLGVMFSRQASTRLYLDARVSQNLLPVTNNGSTGQGLYPTEIVGQLGIGW